MCIRDTLSARLKRESGLTMVEMALVVLIIGILMAVYLNYEQTIRYVRLRRVAAEVLSFGTAARNFENKYEALPGDFDEADEMISGCESGNANFCVNGDGDGRIGRWCTVDEPNCNQTGSSIPAADGGGRAIPHAVPLETSMFWKHLLLSRMIGTIITRESDPDASPLRWGQSHPESALRNSGYVVSSQSHFIGGSVNIINIPTPEYTISVTEAPAAGGNAVFTVIDAIYMDVKYDGDATSTGNPGGGSIWWYPLAATGSTNACRRSEASTQWEMNNLNLKNCYFMWTVF